MKLTFLVAAIAAFSTALTTHASSIAVDPVENGGSTSFGGSQTLGWTFTANDNIIVTELGYYDFGFDGLGESHQVGIWNLDGPLLGSAIVTTGDPIIDGFRYEPSSPILLLAGQSYVIGGFQSANVDRTLTSASGMTSFTTAPEITFGEERNMPTASFSRPDESHISGGAGAFGPNFQFEPTTIPEPTTIVLLASASAA
jgi:hypothetical protein